MDHINNAIVDLGVVMIHLNHTLGLTREFSANSIEISTNALAGKTFNLKMTFFFRNYLPKTDSDSFGKIRVDLFP